MLKRKDGKPKSSTGGDMYYRDKQLELEHEIQLFGLIDNATVSDIHSKLSYLNSAIYYSEIDEQREELVKKVQNRMAELDHVKQFRAENPKSKKKDSQIIKEAQVKIPKDVQKDIDKANELLKILMPNDTIKIWLKSGGGSIMDCLALIDMIDACEVPVEIIGTGYVMSAAVPLLMSGTKGYRGATKNCTFMAHHSTCGVYGNSGDIRNEAELLERLDTILKQIALDRTKIKSRQYDKMDQPRCCYFGAEEALKYGIIDYIVEEV